MATFTETFWTATSKEILGVVSLLMGRGIR